MRKIKDYDYIASLIKTYEGKNIQVAMEFNFVVVSFLGNEGGNEIEVTTVAPYTLELYAALNILSKHLNHGY